MDEGVSLCLLEELWEALLWDGAAAHLGRKARVIAQGLFRSGERDSVS